MHRRRRLLFSIADALAKEMKHPAFAARAYRVLLARMAARRWIRSPDVKVSPVNASGKWFSTFVGSLSQDRSL
ncbi:hypothetical protein I553_10677 [Mycobacterium xenopi 4042]|uniref:Uncharacterized protein n=1 Tax=Mycobacterium xenopi 4042 TaxID=1299334 RepID=X8DD29_MYCXE|nr:hypothetical protein I553_10677 [Mycobacterium xenopi 4042]